jgi:hypothetical protein
VPNDFSFPSRAVCLRFIKTMAMIYRNEDVFHSTKVCDDYARENNYLKIWNILKKKKQTP